MIGVGLAAMVLDNSTTSTIVDLASTLLPDTTLCPGN